MLNYVVDGLIGFCVGDALGLPAEFRDRRKLQEKPVVDLEGYGTHNQPAGAWSDDSSMTFCLAESLIDGLNYNDIGDKFCRWAFEGYWTPFGKAFGIGRTTLKALSEIKRGCPAAEAGGKSEKDNGNGSLMRVLPLVFFLNEYEGDESYKIIHDVSSITHAHIRCCMACSFYVVYGIYLLKGLDKLQAYNITKQDIINYYSDECYKDEISNYRRILNNDIQNYNADDISSSGYVVDTLEAGLWAFLSSSSYKETVLKAVNLGGDTDTIAAIAGGLAGIYYGISDIPEEWINKIARKDDIYELGRKLFNKLEQ